MPDLFGSRNHSRSLRTLPLFRREYCWLLMGRELKEIDEFNVFVYKGMRKSTQSTGVKDPQRLLFSSRKGMNNKCFFRRGKFFVHCLNLVYAETVSKRNGARMAQQF